MTDFWPPVKPPGNLIDRIEQFLVDNEIEPGGRLPAEREMARLLGVSRPALREAVKVLEARGRAVVRHGQGMVVARTAPEAVAARLSSLEVSLRERFDMRTVLEKPAAAWAAQEATARDLAVLADTLATEKAARTEPIDFDRLKALDAAIHLRIVESAKNRFLRQTLGLFQEMLASGMETTLTIPGRVPVAGADHDGSSRRSSLVIRRPPERLSECKSREHATPPWPESGAPQRSGPRHETRRRHMRVLEAESLSGVLVALLTPIGDDGAIDHDAAARLSADLLGRGVRGICPAGTTGEGASLSLSERLGMVDAVVASVPPGTPVVPGVFQDAFVDVRREIDAYAEHGASAVLLAPPHYYVLSSEDLRGYYEEIAVTSPLPLVVYNIPAFTKNQVPPSQLVALAAHPQVIGLKDSSRDMEYFLSVLDGLREAGIGPDRFAVTTGTDTMLLTSLFAGAQGAIVASANVGPELSCGTHAAWEDGDLDRAKELEARLRRLVIACRLGSYPAGWKAAAAMQGACRPWMVRPRQPLDERAQSVVAETLRSLDLLGPRP